MNKVIKLLMVSDIFLITGFGLIEPILAIFIKEDLVGGTILTVGLASTLFLITKSIVQLPFSRYIDSHKDKMKWLVAGTFMVAFVPFIYIFAESINFIYIAQIIYGIGSGLAYPAWLSLWSTNLDRRHEGFEWSLYSTLTGLGTAASATVGAVIAQFIGFKYTFLLVGLMSMIGGFILFNLERQSSMNHIDPYHYHKKRKLIHKKHH